MYGFAGFIEGRGQLVEFATDEAGHRNSLRSIGCPENMIKGVIACAKRNRNKPRPAQRPNLGDNSAEIARLKYLNAERCRKAKPLTQAERIARVTAAVVADIPFLDAAAEQERQQKADEALRERMEAAAGITNRRRNYQPN